MEQVITKIKNLCKTQPDLVVFGIFVFLLPVGTQHFITVLLPYSDQVFNFWSAAFLYFSDILLVICLILWLLRVLKRRFQLDPRSRMMWSIMGFFTAILIVSTLLNPNPQLSWYGVVKWAEVLLLCGYTLSVVVTWRRRFMVSVLFFAAVSVQAILGVLQFLNQQSLGLKWLGESMLSTSIANVAEIVAQNQTWLRAYGTQSHPNVLGYLLVVALMFAIYLYVRVKSTNWRVAISALAGLQVMALLMTFSRMAWLALLIGAGVIVVLSLVWRGPRSWPTELSTRSILPLIITTLITVASVITLWPLLTGRLMVGDSHGDLAVSYRHELNLRGWDRFASHPLIGIGPKQFVPSLVTSPEILSEPWKFQPIHEAYLLLLTETGVIGVIGFGAIIVIKFIAQAKKLKNVPRGTFFNQCYDILYVFIMISILVLSLFVMFYDHYIIDIQQSSLTFWLLMGL